MPRYQRGTLFDQFDTWERGPSTPDVEGLRTGSLRSIDPTLDHMPKWRKNGPPPYAPRAVQLCPWCDKELRRAEWRRHMKKRHRAEMKRWWLVGVRRPKIRKQLDGTVTDLKGRTIEP